MNRVELLQLIFGLIITWAGLSIIASAAQVDLDNCSNDYPIGYFIQTKLFCPIEEVQSDQP